MDADDGGVMRLDPEDRKREIKKRGGDLKTMAVETIVEEGNVGSINSKGNTFDELSENLKGFSKNSYIVEDERNSIIRKHHNLRRAYLLLVEAGEPVMIGDFKNKINLGKTSQYALFHKLREMGLVKTIAVMNVFLVGSPHLKNEDFDDDDINKFTEKEKNVVRQKFRKWTSGMKTSKQKQTYRSSSFYWALDTKGKDPTFLKLVISIENQYKKQEKKEDTE